MLQIAQVLRRQSHGLCHFFGGDPRQLPPCRQALPHLLGVINLTGPAASRTLMSLHCSDDTLTHGNIVNLKNTLD